MILSVEEYKAMRTLTTKLDDDAMEALLKEAEEDVNVMTYGRIAARGFDALTEFQQSKVKKAIARQADFREQYTSILSAPLASYSINGVSMSWDKGELVEFGGVYTSRDVLGLLNQSGLTYRGVV